jgi:hypothetical protein
MTVSDDTETPLWVVGSGRQRSRPVPPKCALCPAPPASAFGLCDRCLSAAAAEHALITPESGRRPDSVQVRDLCSRCGSSRHSRATCDA